MRFLALTCVLLGLIGLVGDAHARPVSYPDGWTVMQRNNADFSSAHVHYSPTFQDSIGLYIEQNWTDDATFYGLQYNRLIKRWNGEGSQANFYAKLGGGYADGFGDRDSDLSGFAGLAVDWETRRWFTSYELRATDFADNQSVHHSARVGVAPYLGDYGDLHSWVMVEIANHPEGDKALTTTPLLRFFKGVQMVELGYTIEQERALLNWIYRF